MTDPREVDPVDIEEAIERIKSLADGLDAVGEQLTNGKVVVPSHKVRKLTKNFGIEVYHLAMQMEEGLNDDEE